MDNKEFIKKYPIELGLLGKEARALRKVIKEANESYVYEVIEEKGVKTKFGQYYNFYIYCPTTSFANAYFHFGILYTKHVLPIWESRFKKNNQTSN